MKKFLLACCMITMFNISFSQTIQLTNGGSTTTSGGTAASPVSQFFEYMRFQVVYTAAEINAAGISGAKSITQLGWYVTTATANALPSYTVRMANTTATNAATHNTATLTQVYTNASYTPVAGGFDMLSLNGSFIWDGTSNVLVDVCYGAAVYASPYGEVRTYAASTTNGSRRTRCDACGSQCSANTNTINSFKPQVSLTFTPPAACSAPTGLAANPISPVSESISWNTVAGAVGYEYVVNTTAGNPVGSGTPLGGTSATAGGLTASTLHYLHVRADCGGGTFSSWSTIAFTTLCAATTIPYLENFDAASTNPPCFVFQDLNGNTTWTTFVGTAGTTASSGTNSIRYNWNGSIAANDWFFIRSLTLNAGTTYRIKFKYKGSDGPTYIEQLEVKYGTAPNATSMTTGTLFTNTNINSALGSPFAEGAGDFMPPSSGTYYVGFHCFSAADQAFLYIDDIEVIVAPLCSEPTALNAALATDNAGTASWTAPLTGTPTGYEYVIDNIAAAPAGSGTATAAVSVPFSGLTTGLQYYLHVRTVCAGGIFSPWATVSFVAIVNDNICGAINLTVGGPQDCRNTQLATSSGDPALSCSGPNNTVWYKYTPASTGTVLVRTEIPGATSIPLDGWVAFYSATGTCPTLSLTQLGVCTEFGISPGAIDTIISPVLTGGETYYIMIDGFSGSSGEFCISLVVPPPPPVCTTNLTPVNGATNVLIPGGSAAIAWNTAANATSYDVYFDTVNPPISNIGNSAGTTVNITGLNYNTTYYWYVAPKNGAGSATGCDASTTSFTTENPTNCVPLYTTGCSDADSLAYFSLKGASGTVIYNRSGGTCNVTPAGYSDYTTAFPAVTLVRGESFGGFMRTGYDEDYASIWIDGNDNGYFENNERVMNNLKIGTVMKLYTLYIPTTTPLGTHRMRIRVIYSATKPATVTDPCGNYGYGETEDYLVNITNIGSGHGVGVGTPGACMDAGAITIDAASNNNGSSPVFLVDSLNNYIAAIYPGGNNLGAVTASYYINNGPVRQTSQGRYYLDRNMTITVDTQPTTAYNLRYFFRTNELNALIAQPGSGVTSIFDLGLTKTTDIVCRSAYVGVNYPQGIFPTGFGSLAGDRFLDFTSLNGFSAFYLHGGGSLVLPTGLLSFSGQKEGAVNKLRWTTSTEQNNRGFEVQRSTDGVNYTVLGFVNSLAAGGNSTGMLNYSFVDNTPAGAKQYYRLRQVDIDNQSKLSNIVLVKGAKSSSLVIDGLFPNPANDQLNILVGAPAADRFTIMVTDIAGKVVLQKAVQTEIGSNTISLDISTLTNGQYIIRLVNSTYSESPAAKFIKH